MPIELVFARQERPAGLSTLEQVRALAEGVQDVAENAAADAVAAAQPVLDGKVAAAEAGAAAATSSYSSYSATSAAAVPLPVLRIAAQVRGRVVEWVSDPAGVALETNGGARKWSPASDISVEHFGAVGDGETDDHPAFQAAVDYAGSLGGAVVYARGGAYALADTVEVRHSNVKLRGAGNDMQHLNSGSGDGAATVFRWVGAVGGRMFSFISPQGPANHKRVGQELSNCYLDGRGIATKGINILSVNDLLLSRIHIENVTEDAVYARCYNTGQLSDATDNQRMRFEIVTFNLASGINTTNANGINLGGSAVLPGGNTSLNVFELCQGGTQNGTALLCDNADNCNFIRCGFTCGTNGTYAVEIRGNGACGSLHFFNLTAVRNGAAANPAIKISGVASGYQNNPVGNSFWMSDNHNGTQAPLADPDCKFVVVQDNGYSTGMRFGKAAFGREAGGATRAQDALGTATVVVHNESSNHLKLIDTLQNEYGLNISSNGNLRISRSSGAGLVEIANTRLSAGVLAPCVTFTTGQGVGSNDVVFVDASSGNISVSLPLAGSFPSGRTPIIRIRRIDTSENTVAVLRQGADTVNSGTSDTLSVGQGKAYACNPATAAWYSV